MNVFQWLSVSVLGILLMWELAGMRRAAGPRTFRVFRCVIWLGTSISIARPNLVQKVAEVIGIGRGADVVLYGFVLAFLGVSFFFYSRYLRLQRQITELSRQLALQHPSFGDDRTELPPEQPERQPR